MTSNLNIRFATKNDVSTILTFIKALAEYEKLLHEVEATEEILLETLFSDKPYAEVLIAELDDMPVGLALFFHNFSTFLGRPGIYLEDLYVSPTARGKGVGKKLLSHLARLAIERQCGRLEWIVLDWNEPAINFYKKLNATSMDEWTINRVTGDALKDLANA